jgi:uncharacterized membrane protein YphA (DoxX/SURF4 family)
MQRRIITDFVLFALILTFVYAAVSKLLGYDTFRIQLGQSPLLTKYASFLAWAVPAAELLVALLLILPAMRLAALHASLFLMALFTSYIVAITRFSDFVPCSCGGVLERLGWNEHLIFNTVLMILIGVGLYFERDSERKAGNSERVNAGLIKPVLVVLFLGIGFTATLYALSDRHPEYQHATFYRAIAEPGLDLTGTLNLGFDSYYFAGLAKEHMYLGNTTAPTHFVTIGKQLTDTLHARLVIPNLRYRSMQLSADSPRLYLFDGTMPFIFRGAFPDQVMRLVVDSIDFVRGIALKDDSFVFSVVHQRKNSFAKLGANAGYIVFTDILSAQGEGIFSTDGMFHFDREDRRLVYVYYYRNEYVVMDTSLHEVVTGNTIDPVGEAQIKVGVSGNGRTMTLAAPPLVVNKSSYVTEGRLFVQSNILARNEDRNRFSQEDVIDVYDLLSREYRYSFYVPSFKGKKISAFAVRDRELFALHGTYLVRYRLVADVYR